MVIDTITQKVIHCHSRQHQTGFLLTVAAVFIRNKQKFSLLIAHKNNTAAIACQHIQGHTIACIELVVPVCIVPKLEICLRAQNGLFGSLRQLRLRLLQRKTIDLIDEGASQDSKAQNNYQRVNQKITCK